MAQLFDHKGNPLAPSAAATNASAHKKSEPPKLGEAFPDRWPIGNEAFYRLPGGGLLQFDLNQLTLEDYRSMKDHYQVNASLAVLTFMMHQMDWRIECDNAKIATAVEEQLKQVWTRLVRALSQAFWAGYSPNILQWENDIEGKRVVLSKIKDLRPEMCEVNWKAVEGWAPPGHVKPKIPIYDGIKQYGLSWPIPAENTLWYPLLMENSNFYGRKLLRAAFTPWYFSQLIHMFANRYMERFGEPIPVGRAPYETVVNPDGTKTTGVAVMANILSNLRNRGVVVLPDDRSILGTNSVEFDYQIEYLESQMRGADFERYLMRLDEEISLSMFTPLLILRTADVGSYNLGSTHWNMYQQMLNSLAGDWGEYIDRYIIAPMVRFNFSATSAKAHIKFRQLGAERLQAGMTMLQALISGGMAKPDLAELGAIVGMSVSEVKQVTAPSVDPNAPPANDPNNPGGNPPADGGGGGAAKGDKGGKGGSTGSGGGNASGGKGSSSNSRQSDRDSVRTGISARIAGQIERARRAGDSSITPDLGYRKQLDALVSSANASRLEHSYAALAAFVIEGYEAGVADLSKKFENVLDGMLKELVDA